MTRPGIEPRSLRPLANTQIIWPDVKLAILVEGNPKSPFSIATTPWCSGGRYSIPRIDLLCP